MNSGSGSEFDRVKRYIGRFWPSGWSAAQATHFQFAVFAHCKEAIGHEHISVLSSGLVLVTETQPTEFSIAMARLTSSREL